MPKYYVQSGPVRLIFSAASPKDAAIAAFQWTCERQAEIDVENPVEHIELAEENGWQMHESICVNERGFDRDDSRVFDTLDIVAAWHGDTFPWQ